MAPLLTPRIAPGRVLITAGLRDANCDHSGESRGKVMRNLSYLAFGPLLPVTIVATPANADSADAEFLSDLREHGIWFTDPHTVINYAHGVCAQMASGKIRADIADTVLRDDPSFNNWDNADWFVIIANTDYCPWLEPPKPSPGVLGGGPE